MSYRLPEEWKPLFPHRKTRLGDVSRQSSITVDNGTITRMTIPCYYSRFLSRYDKMILDYVGWPNPNHRDHSNYRKLIAINEVDLVEEGYDHVEIAMINPPAGLDITGYLDKNVVRLIINTMCNSAIEDDLYVDFAIYIYGSSRDDSNNVINLRDLVTKGVLHIIAGAI